MKIHILFNFCDFNFSGGNNFLRILREKFVKRDMYVDCPEFADVILFNSHHRYEDVVSLRKKIKAKFVHRLDGIYTLYNNSSDIRQDIVLSSNRNADATIFQSNWVRNEYFKLGICSNIPNTVIYNSSDDNIFNRNNCEFCNQLITTSWSSNINKGFNYYRHIDENLDFHQFSYILIGNSPFSFKNIKYISPKDSSFVASELKNSAIFISGSVFEACSNSIIEALLCGVPCLAVDSGSNREIIGDGGCFFKKNEEIIPLINSIYEKREEYSGAIRVKDINCIVGEYISFFKNIL